MNCARCRKRLYEYLDGALSARARAAMDNHLQSCPACQKALAEETASAATLRNLLRRGAEPITLRGDMQARVLSRAAQTRGVAWADAFAAFWSGYRLRVALAASTVAVAVAVLGLWQHFRRSAATHAPSHFECVLTTYADDDPSWWTRRTLLVCSKNGVERFAQITVTRSTELPN